MRRARLLAVLVPLAGAQNLRPVEPAQRAHARVVVAERTAAFFASWDAADGASRTRAARALERLRPERAPLGRRPTLEELSVARRVLAGEAFEEALRPLARFADALDLQVVPGVFEPAREGRGEPLTVRVYRLLPPRVRAGLGGTVRLSLIWVAPDGSERRARTEPFGVAAFDTPGFEMYVRAPLSAAGTTWRLVPELALGESSARGPGVAVECCPAARARIRALGAEPARERAELVRLLERGLRFSGGESVCARLARLEGPSAGAVARPLAGGPFAAALAPFGHLPGDARAYLAFLAPAGELPETLFGGPPGRAWRELAARRGYGLVALETRPTERGALGRGLEELGESGKPVVLVARGDTVGALRLLFPDGAGGPGVALDGLVLVPDRFAVPSRAAEVPTLVVSATDDGDPRPGWTVVAGGGDAFTSEPLLPALVERWLEDEVVAGTKGG